MNRFAELLDRLAYEPGRNNKLRLMTAYFRETPDPDRGYALAALTGALSFKHAKSGLVRDLIATRADPVLFALSYDYVGDLSETVALMWPQQHPTDASSVLPAVRGSGTEKAKETGHVRHWPSPTLTDVVTTLRTLGKAELPAQLARWLDQLDETGRWALLKLVTGAMRIGVSARLAKTAVAALGSRDAHDVELIWPGLAPPYPDLFAWLEGRGDRPVNRAPAPFRPVMLAHAIEDADFARLDAADFTAEWKWDGIRVQAVSGRDAHGNVETRLYSRTGEDITRSFPDLLPSLRREGSVEGRLNDSRESVGAFRQQAFAIDGELLVVRDGRVQSFNVLQQRLNRKAVTPRLMKEFPVHLRAYDLLADGDNDLRELPFEDRRRRLVDFIAALDDPRIDLSPQVSFATWSDLAAIRADPAEAGADADAVEGVMLKRRDAPYMPGRPKGLWWKWKRDPHVIDAVLMYAQRGHGRRSSYYSDYTFGVWTAGEEGERLVPVGKAYFGFTDEELLRIDRFVRRNTTESFGPVRHVLHEPDQGLVLEIAFEGLQRSARHKSGVAMRFPRINRLRWDKPPREADRLETLERMLASEATRSNGR
ncbi:cisplatin damage response ATP-dependent DNA ligase [Nitrobacter winogradskyi]|uniref:DNA ligase-1 n=2 Tax=Nitrobacter winogradskyi TaxID=913 RepID=A0ACC6AN10_NITWI|nr:cisplatin damage response ATP-dependent DNA ligase [Nitrobacter winogradskyi]MCP2000562.1 DNA ligase-1 [Nitrobacter winogradskyi]GEC14863.1 ATP-dependent DNA ligase [Nitrobacter winogradskyi]